MTEEISNRHMQSRTPLSNISPTLIVHNNVNNKIGSVRNATNPKVAPFQAALASSKIGVETCSTSSLLVAQIKSEIEQRRQDQNKREKIIRRIMKES